MQPDLLSQVLVAAQTRLISNQRVPWTLHALNGNKQGFVMSGLMSGPQQKQMLYQGLRLWALANVITEYCVVMEAWAVFAQNPDVDVQTHPDRKSCLIITHVIRRDEKRLGRVRMFNIIKEGSTFKTLERITLPPETTPDGEVFTFISAATPTSIDSRTASEVLSIGQKSGLYPSFDEIGRVEI